MRRIVVVSPGDDSYGIDRVLLQIVSALVGAGHLVGCVLESENPGTGWASAQLAKANVPCTKAPLNNLQRSVVRSLPTLATWLVKLIHRLPALVRMCRNADVVYINGFAMVATALAGRLARRTVIWHLHEIPPSGRIAGYLVRALSTQRICVSHAVADAFGLAESTRTRVVHNGVPVPAHAVTHRVATDAAPLEVGIVARINHFKGHLVLAEAFLQSIADGVPIRLHVVGASHASDSTVAERLQSELAEVPAGHVVWAGEVPSGAAYMNDLHVLVAPSIRPDPFPLSVLEGMAAGLVVIATNSGGHPEAITNDINGLLVAPGSATEIAAHLRALAEDTARRAKLGAAARDYVERNLRPDQFAEGVTAVVQGTP